MQPLVAVIAIVGILLIVGLLRRIASPHAYARSGMNERLCRLISGRPSAVNDRDGAGEAPLHHAAKYGEIACMEALINHGADVNARSTEDVTPLHYAAAFGELEAVKLLLSRGAIVDPIEKTGMTPIMAAQAREHSEIIALLTSSGADLRRPSFLVQDSKRGVAALSPDDPLLIEAKAKAKETFEEFREFLEKDPANCSVKFPYATLEGVEHIWGQPLSLIGEKMQVRLISKPLCKTKIIPSSIELSLEDVEDWQYIRFDNQIRGGFTMLAAFKRILETNGQLPEEIASELPRFLDYTPSNR